MRTAKVFIQAGPHRSFESTTARTFKEQGDRYQIVQNLKEADIVVWTGGEDIWPGLYGEKPLGNVYWTDRDKYDVDAVDKAFGAGKFLVGICRGAQLLNVVPNGGKLWQDVDNHDSCVHKSFDCITGEWVYLNSVHHQSLKLTDKAQLLAWAQESDVKKSEGMIWKRPKPSFTNGVLEKDKDVEAAWYGETNSLLIQGHPEFGHPPTTSYFFGLMDKFYWRK